MNATNALVTTKNSNSDFTLYCETKAKHQL